MHCGQELKLKIIMVKLNSEFNLNVQKKFFYSIAYVRYE